ncbi:hypothetical protein Droror1_Dr00012269, partial [Drosera rotundifolia]
METSAGKAAGGVTNEIQVRLQNMVFFDRRPRFDQYAPRPLRTTVSVLICCCSTVMRNGTLSISDNATCLRQPLCSVALSEEVTCVDRAPWSLNYKNYLEEVNPQVEVFSLKTGSWK